MTDTTVRFKPIQDLTTYDFMGTRKRMRRYTFFVGAHGPFVEDVPLEPTFDPAEIDRRIAQLVPHLANK